MEKVIEYLRKQSEILPENIEKFREETSQYHNSNPAVDIWNKISQFIDQAGDIEGIKY